MEDKGLSIEEKKQLWHALQVVRKIGVKEMHKSPLEQERDCAPLFHTSIDNVPVWEGDRYYQCTDRGNPVEAITLEYNNSVKGVETSSTREAAEDYLKDNRTVKLGDVFALIKKHEYTVATIGSQSIAGYCSNIKAVNVETIKEGLYKISNQ